MSERILLLRTCGQNGEAHDGFLWPLTVGSVVEPERWDPNPKRDCGDALHALAWGEGDGSLLNWSPDARWLVVSADAADVLPARGGKNRCRRVVVEHVGDRESATRYLIDHGAAGRAVVGASVTAGDYGTATAGDRGTATAGDYGTATAGDYGTATAGDRGTVCERWYDRKASRARIAVGYVGENGIEARVAYRADDNGKLIAVAEGGARR